MCSKKNENASGKVKQSDLKLSLVCLKIYEASAYKSKRSFASYAANFL